MYRYTKCDLSAGLAKIDLVKLTEQTEKHYYCIVDKILQKMQEIKNNAMTQEGRKQNILSMVACGSNELLRWAKDESETAELLRTLQESKDREIEIIKE